MRCLYPITRETSEMDSKGTSLKMVSAKGTETSDNNKKKLKNKQTQNRLRIHPDSNPSINYLMLYKKNPVK